jgi:dynein heavy chain, axonemal
MKTEWEFLDINFVPYKDTGVKIIASFEDIQALHYEHVIKTTTMKNSPFVKPFEKDVTDWYQHLVKTVLFLR